MNILKHLSTLNLTAEQSAAVLELLQKQQAIEKNLTLRIVTQDQLIAQLQQSIATLHRIKFGRKSEKLHANPHQLDLFTSDVEADIAQFETGIEQLTNTINNQKNDEQAPDSKDAVAPASKTPVKRTRKPFATDLPRVDHLHDITNTHCEVCHSTLNKIRDEVTEKIEYIPAQVIIHRHIYPQYSCPCCQIIKAEPAVPSLIQGSIAEPSVWAHVLVAKYVDHLPLYRLASIFARHDIDINRSVMSSWVGVLGFHLQPLFVALRKQLFSQRCLHADETPIQQLEPGAGKTKKSYLWAYRSNDLEGLTDRIIVFDYHDNRKGINASSFLHGWSGHLLVDDFAGYKALFASQTNVIELGCMAHARRKFYELYSANNSVTAKRALEYIADLYAVEKACKDMGEVERHAYRQTHALPKLAEYKQWLDTVLLQASPNSGIAKATAYSVRRFSALSRYAETGHLPIDNNPVENCIRPIAIGKKNWMFTGSKEAGERAAVIQTLLGTAKLNGIEPYAWLKHVLTVLPTTKNTPEEIKKLLPLSSFKIPD
jgi:transposase